MNLITVTDLQMQYGGTPVFSDLSFTVAAGDFLGIVGENGSGKTTLVQGLLGLKTPAAGEIRLGLRKNEIGYLPQKTAVQSDFPATVREVVQSGFLNRMGLRPFPAERDRAKAGRWMEKLGLLGLERRSFRALSGGQQQRVLLARALCAADRLLILDEPVAGLDPEATAEFYRLVEALHREGVTVVMVSHDLQNVLRCADHMLHLRAQDAFFGTVDAYRAGDFCPPAMKGGA